MDRIRHGEKEYRVLLIRVGEDTEEERKTFCNSLSDHFGIDLSIIRKIVERSPLVLKKNLSLRKADILARTLKAFGATVSVEEKYESPPIFLEFQETPPFRVALESSYLRKTESGTWNVVGRVKNISSEGLMDPWVLIQLFDRLDELITFEEIPLPINPLPPGETSPFKVVFEGGLSVEKVSVALKSASGAPLPAMDRRKKRDWVEIELKEENGKIISPASLFLEEPGETRPFEPAIASEQPLFDTPSVLPVESAFPAEPDRMSLPTEERAEETREEEKGEEPFGLQEMETPSGLSPEETVPLPDNPSEETESPGRAPAEEFLNEAVLTPIPREDLSNVTEEEKPEETERREEGGPVEPVEASALDLSPLEEPSPPTEKLSLETEEEAKEVSPFPWIDDFRNALVHYYQERKDLFVIWFEAVQRGRGFENPFHSLLTILTHARFEQGSDQMDQLEKALENTRRVFELIPQSPPRLEEIPLLEGTPFLSGEIWRDLFHRALPRIQHITGDILKKQVWEGPELECLIQIVPHMSHRSSRKAIRRITALLPDPVEIDLPGMTLSIGEDLYRVASRLGVVDPHFDHYHGRQSTGDLKIQSFAKMVYPQDPMFVEEPMTWLGKKEEEGGKHCFPTFPRCEGCLFEGFCPKLFMDFNPSLKGMRSDS